VRAHLQLDLHALRILIVKVIELTARPASGRARSGGMNIGNVEIDTPNADSGLGVAGERARFKRYDVVNQL